MLASGRVVVSALLLLACVAVIATPARAQSPSGPADDTAARALFEEGRAAYAEGRYEEALELFERVYVRSPFPELLFNVGLLHQRLGHDRAALGAFEEYLEMTEEGADRGEVERRIRMLRIRLREAEGLGEETPRAVDEEADPEADQEVVVSPTNPPAGDAQPQVAAWALLGSGAALLIGGAVALVFGALERAAVEGSTDGELGWTEALDRLAISDGLVVGGAIGIGVGAALGLVAIPFFQTEGVTVSLRGPGLQIGGAF